MKKKYKVQGDTKNTFMNIELDLVLEDDSIGSTCDVLGGTFTITQNGPILVLVEKDWCLTLMDVTPKPKIIKPKLVINETLDLFFEPKEVRVQCKCTYGELFDALKKEWEFVGKLRPESFPFEYDSELKLFTFLNDWGFTEGSFPNMTGGSFSRKNLLGRNI